MNPSAICCVPRRTTAKIVKALELRTALQIALRSAMTIANGTRVRRSFLNN